MKQQFRRKDDDRYMSPRFEVDSTIIPTLGEIVFHQLYDETGWKVTDITKRYWSDRGGETTLCLEIEIEEIKEVILSHSIRQMQEMDGWRIVSEFIEKKLIFHKSQLLSCSLEEVMKHRNMIEAYKSIPIHLDGIIKESLTE
jgi:hypothetical protein